LERKYDPREVGVGGLAAIIWVCPRLKENSISHDAPSSRLPSFSALMMLSNLLQSYSRVQQLFVRVIFLPGISDSSKPIRHLTFLLSKSLADAEGSLQTRRIKQTTTVSSASSAGTSTQMCGKNDYAPATTTASQGRLTRRLPCAGVRVAFADQSLSEENSLPKASGRAPRFTWFATPCSPVIPPRNNRVTRSCWTSSLSKGTFAPQAAAFADTRQLNSGE
jgi:hypothetical protein